MNQELTQEQIDRQDYVDDMIYVLVNALVPEGLRPVATNAKEFQMNEYPVAWDMSYIADIRDRIEEYIRVGLGATYTPLTKDRDKFEMAFYPYLTEEE